MTADGEARIDDVDAGWSAHLPSGTVFDPGELTAAGTLVARWLDHWRRHPDRPVLHDPSEGWLTGDALTARSAAAAARLAAHGVGPGDRVLLSGPNGSALAVTHVGVLRLGAVVVPVNGAYRAAEVRHIARDSGAAAAVVADAGWSPWIAEGAPGAVVLDLAVVGDPSPVDGSIAVPALDRVTGDRPALIGYTSGTTGAPKGAVLSHANLLAGVEALRVAWRWAPEDRLVLCLPLFHMHGLGVGLHGTLAVGASAVLLDGFDTDRVLDVARAHGATLFFGVPTMYHRFAASPRVGELAAFRLCVAGSAALPASVHATLEERAGVRVLERYGMTETVMLVSNPYDGERRPGSVGLPLPGVELRMARAGRAPVGLAAAAADGETGEILVRGPNVFGGYWQRPDADSDAFVDGWFRTGDLGVVDPDGYVRIAGRAKELIISGGFNIHPREVEDVLAEHDAIAEVAVVGLPSEEWGEEVAAFVVVAPACTAPSVDDLRSFGAVRLARFKLPRQVVVVDALPRNALGKVVKHELRALVERRDATGTRPSAEGS